MRKTRNNGNAQLRIDSSLWAVLLGLARNAAEYKALLMVADQPRQNDYDGRGSSSEQALRDFCAFFLRVSIDQVRFMQSILDPANLLRRIELYCRDESEAGRLPRTVYPVLREALLQGLWNEGRFLIWLTCASVPPAISPPSFWRRNF